MYRVEGRRPVGRPRKTWLESVEADMSLSMPYVCIVIFRVFACISTWALGILKTCFINESQIDKVIVYLVIFTTAL